MKRDTFNQVQSESIAQLHWIHEQKEEKRFKYLYLITLNTEILKNSSTLNIQNGMRLYDKDLKKYFGILFEAQNQRIFLLYLNSKALNPYEKAPNYKKKPKPLKIILPPKW